MDEYLPCIECDGDGDCPECLGNDGDCEECAGEGVCGWCCGTGEEDAAVAR